VHSDSPCHASKGVEAMSVSSITFVRTLTIA
jgi:hypothetical protein